MSEKHDGSSGYDTASCRNRGDRGEGWEEWIDYVLFPFILIDGYKEHIGGVRLESFDACLVAGERWMNLDRETQMLMRTRPDYTKFV